MIVIYVLGCPSENVEIVVYFHAAGAVSASMQIAEEPELFVLDVELFAVFVNELVGAAGDDDETIFSFVIMNAMTISRHYHLLNFLEFF